jgi:serine/threonine protein kinase
MAGPQIGDRISEYVLDQQVGAGSFGQVWKAHHHIWKTDIVAIKIPTDTQFVQNLQKEGIAIHGLRHPNIVRAIGLDPYAETPYLVMEYVDGISLAEVISKHPRGLPIGAVQQILAGVLRALEHAHSHNVIHHDIKPANILVGGAASKKVELIGEADIKVTDFGLGHAGEMTTQSILQSGSLLAEEGRSISGTLAYMSPEQRDGQPTDARSDLYSVGIVLFELVCGERPSGSDLPSHMREGLPAWVDMVHSRLHTRKERRLASATEVLRLIETGSVPPVIRSAGYVNSSKVPPVPREAESDRCPTCGAGAVAGDNFCIHCGTQLVALPRRCDQCGGFPAADDRYCVFCGTVLAGSVG